MSKEFKVLYFASAKDATNLSSETISFPSPSPSSSSNSSSSISLQELTQILKSRHEKLGKILEYSMYAINMKYVEIDDTSVFVKEGDEVAVIPPVSGG